MTQPNQNQLNQKKLQVFVSSTYSDLIKERQAAVEEILASGHIPAGMELFSSGDESQMDVIKRWIRESDVYLLILGGRYGSIDPKTKKSYTQLEYEYALSLGKRVFACVISEAALQKRKDSGTSGNDGDNRKKLEAFRDLVLTRIIKFWDDERDIRLIIGRSLRELSKDDDLIGWVRAPAKGSSAEALSNSGIRFVTPRRKELSKEFHDRKYTAEKFDLVAVAVKDCLKEMSDDRDGKMIERILFHGLRCHIMFAHPEAPFLEQRAIEDGLPEDQVINAQKESVKYVVLFFKKLRAAYDRELEKGTLDTSKLEEVRIRLLYVNPYITIERFDEEMNWGLYTSYTAGKYSAMFSVSAKQCPEVFDQLKNHYKALLYAARGDDLLSLTIGQRPWLNEDLANDILTKEVVDALLK